MHLLFKKLILFICIITCLRAHATIVPCNLFANYAVLQRDIQVPVWGTAADGKIITVNFAGQQVSAKVKDGKWMLKLAPLKPGGPFTMTITGDGEIVLHDILVGDVWLCGGQSNMERQLGPRPPQPLIVNWKAEVSTAVNYPKMRFFYVKQTGGSLQPAEQVNGAWSVCDTNTVKKFSAIGYFFGRAIYDDVKVPIGLIQSTWGGTLAEFWTDKETMRSYPELKNVIDNYEKKISLYPAKLEDDKTKEPILLAQWMADTAKAISEHKPIPNKPQSAVMQYENLKRDAGGLYNAMIHPLMPFGIKGAIWYQGESNSGRAKPYQTLFPALINSWRHEWQQGDFPFLFVQLAPYKGNSPELREAQLLTLKKISKTAMVVTTDCADSIDNVHPPFKQPVGLRLALAARALAYNEKIEYSGPIYQDMKINGNNVILSFTHVGKGLLAKNGELTGFMISGDGKKFVPAKATIQGDKVSVYSDNISNPVAVRYGWNSNPRDNLFNVDGLPASPFRTDVQ